MILQMKKGEWRREKESNSRQRREEGFSLLELIVVLGILATLAFLVALVLDPVQMLARTRDANRVSDLDALVSAIEHAKTNAPAFELGGFDADGSNTATCSGESAQTVYVSVTGTDASGTCASPPSDLPAGWVYSCAPNDGPQDVDGTGWLPIDFAAGGGTPSISALPVDPVSTFASGFYYSYVCGTDGRYELSARMISKQVRTGGQKDVQSNDGGDDIFAYEAGTDLSLSPMGPIGYWPLDGGTFGTIPNGSTAGLEDASGNGNDGIAEDGGGTALAWTTGVNGGAVSCDGVNDAVYINPQPYLRDATDDGNSHTYSVWYKPTGSPPGNDGYPFSRVGYHTGVRHIATDDTARAIFWYFDNSAAGINSGQTFQNGTWYYLVQTMDEVNNEAKLFIDGAQSGSTTAITKALREYASAQYRICGANTFRAFGVVDEPMMFDRVLTVDEIAYQHDSLKP